MKNKQLATISMFSAIIMVLQIVSTYINFGGFPITLTLIPIIVAGAVLGPYAGMLMGLIFGIVVSAMVIIGADPSGAIMFAAHPFITVLACVLKGVLAGYLGALSYKKIKNKKVGIVVDAIITPVTNTFVLYVFLMLFFDTSFATMVATFMSVNFIIELIINVLIAPGLLALINRFSKK